jgi:hypothetical protein
MHKAKLQERKADEIYSKIKRKMICRPQQPIILHDLMPWSPLETAFKVYPVHTWMRRTEVSRVEPGI